MNKTVVIVQPQFFPWRGQFELQSKADVVVLLDTAQWVKRHWYNRNLISTKEGIKWINVPVKSKGHRDIKIVDVEIANDVNWKHKFLATIRHAYSKAPYFNEYFPTLDALINKPWTHIAPLSEAALCFGFTALKRETNFIRASDLKINADKPIERLIEICNIVGAKQYISGPAAKSYIGSTEQFDRAGIELVWMDYSYPHYPQLNLETSVQLSIIDLLFNTGPSAPKYIWPDQKSVKH